MLKHSDKLDQAFPPSFPENRYATLEEVKSFLESKNISWRSLSEVLCKADDGFLIFKFGDITIQFDNLSWSDWSKDEKMVQLSIELKKDRIGKTAVYEYKMKELEELRKNMQLRPIASSKEKETRK